MEEEQLKLSDLRKKDVVRPSSLPTDFVAPANQLDDIIGNTTIEDRVAGSEGALLDGTIAERIQRLTDKKNNFTLLNRQYGNLEENLVRETQGRGITQLGRRNDLITSQRILDAKRKRELADIEDLRGNIETAEALRREAAAATAKSKAEADKIAGMTDKEILFEEAINKLVTNEAAAKRLKKEGYFNIVKDIETYPEKNTPEIQKINEYVEERLGKINFNRNGFQGPIEPEFNESRFTENNFLDEFFDYVPKPDEEEEVETPSLSIAEAARLAEAAKNQ